MIRDFIRIGYSVDGISYDRFLSLAHVERFLLIDELNSMHEEMAPEPGEDGVGGGGGFREKRLRR